jgi:hypothetical protein
MSRRQVVEVELLEHMFFDVVLIDSTEVVKAFDVFKFLAHFRFKWVRYSYDCGVNISRIWGLLQKIELTRQTIIIYVSEHDNSVLNYFKLVRFYKVL